MQERGGGEGGRWGRRNGVSRWQIPAGIVEAMGVLIQQGKAELLGRLARQTEATHELLRRYDGHFVAAGLRAERVVLFNELPYRLTRAWIAGDERAWVAGAGRTVLPAGRAGGCICCWTNCRIRVSLAVGGTLWPMAEEVAGVTETGRGLFSA